MTKKVAARVKHSAIGRWGYLFSQLKDSAANSVRSDCQPEMYFH